MVASYNLRPRNGAGLFSKKKISKEKVKKKDKWGRIQCKPANNIYSAHTLKKSSPNFNPKYDLNW